MRIILSTERLFLRELTPDDAHLVFELNTDKEVLKFTGDESFASIQEARDFLFNYKDYKRNGYGRWGVFLVESNTFIGWCGLKLNSEGFVDIGYRLAKRFWNNGFAFEAAKACLTYGFIDLKLPTIIGRVAKENFASIHVLEKLNMKCIKNEVCMGIADALLYSIDKADFLRLEMEKSAPK